MKALFIGGTGIISTAVSQRALAEGWELTLLNRGNRAADVPGARQITLDVGNEEAAAQLLSGEQFDVAADFIGFTPDQVQRDIRLFSGKVKQYLFISSASAYQRPPVSPVINEGTPLCNPHWAYSRNKIACEETLMAAYRETGFPVTIIRPSHTFANRSLTVPLHGKKGAWQVIRRMQQGKQILVPGDGNALWAAMASSDFASAFVGLMGNIHAIGQAVQITSEESISWNQMMQVVASALGVAYRPCYVPSTLLSKCKCYDYEGALLGDKAYSLVFDNAKLHRLVPGYVQKKRFDQAAPESVAYFLAHPELQVEDPEFDLFCDRVVAIMRQAEDSLAQL